MNVHAHLFDLAFLRHDLTSAEQHLSFLQGDRWLAQFGTALQIVTALNARMFLLRGEWSAACRRYEEVLGAELSRPGDPSSEEGLTRHFLEYGQALAGAGLAERARAAWERELRCPDHAGNWYWKQLIQQAIRERSEVTSHRVV